MQQGEPPLLVIFELLGWDVITPRLVQEINEVLQQPMTGKEENQWEAENLARNSVPRQTRQGKVDKRFRTGWIGKRKRGQPLGQLSGRTEMLQIDAADFYAFLGVYVEMGLERLFSTGDYWKTGRKKKEQKTQKVRVGGSYGTGNGIAKELWAEQQWRAISIAMCHVPEETLFWMESVFNERAKLHYIPSRNVAIDELGWPYKGHSRHRNYNKSKVSHMLSRLKRCLPVHSQTNGTCDFMHSSMPLDSVFVCSSAEGEQKMTQAQNKRVLWQNLSKILFQICHNPRLGQDLMWL